jgi:hypothetical protein
MTKDEAQHICGYLQDVIDRGEPISWQAVLGASIAYEVLHEPPETVTMIRDLLTQEL